MTPSSYLWKSIKDHDLPGVKQALSDGAKIGRQRNIGRGLLGDTIRGNALVGAAVFHWPEGVDFLLEQASYTPHIALRTLAQFLDPTSPELYNKALKIAQSLSQRRDHIGDTTSILNSLKWPQDIKSHQAREFIFKHIDPTPVPGGLWGAVFSWCLKLRESGDISHLVRFGITPRLMGEKDLDIFYQRLNDLDVEQAHVCFANGLNPLTTLQRGTPLWRSAAAQYLADRQAETLNLHTGLARGTRIQMRL